MECAPGRSPEPDLASGEAGEPVPGGYGGCQGFALEKDAGLNAVLG